MRRPVLTFTAMIYAIVKNVVSPARISVRNLEPFRSFGCEVQAMPWAGFLELKLT